MEWKRFLDLLACPDCLERLGFSESARELHCARCGRRYPIRDGVPILMPSGAEAGRLLETLAGEAGQQMQREYEGHASAPSPEAPPPASPPPGLKARLRAWLERLREPLYNPPHEAIARLFESAGEATRILSVGGGPTRNDRREINLNIGAFPNVDVVGDAHQLPFLTGAIDGAWANAVLEHVADAPRVAAEMERVVQPGGLIIVFQPFLQAYHSYPADYWRFTREGVARLFPNCEAIAQGTYVGPTFALLKQGEVYLQHYLPVLFGLQRGGESRAVKLSIAIYTICFYWLKCLDRTLAPHETGHLQASVVYWAGRKR